MSASWYTYGDVAVQPYEICWAKKNHAHAATVGDFFKSLSNREHKSRLTTAQTSTQTATTGCFTMYVLLQAAL